MKRRRLLPLLLSVLMVLALAPAVPNASYAVTMEKVSVSTMEGLRTYLQESGNYDITVTKDLSMNSSGSYSYWCTVFGNKALNLNGHEVVVSNDTKVSSSTLINVPKGASLTIYDSANSSKSSLRYNAYIDDAGTQQVRNIVDVLGSLTLNGGSIEAGRSKSFYSAKYATTVWKQTFGNGVIVRNGGTFTVNAGNVYGRGSYASIYAGIVAEKGSNVYFNNGNVRAKGGADCFDISSGANVRVALGHFTCETLDAVKVNGSITKGPGKGHVRLGKATQAPGAMKFTTNTLEDSTDLTMYAYGTTENIQVKSGTISNNHAQLLSSNPVIYTTDAPGTNPYGYNFRNVDTNSRGISYGIWYRWMLWEDGSHILADTGYVLSKKEINVTKDFGVTLEKGKTYYLRAFYEERLLDAKFAGSNTNISFTVQDDAAAPVITKQPPTEIAAKVGETKTISVSASGSGLSYQWYSSSDGKSWVIMNSAKTRILTLSNITASMNGKFYRCHVLNSAGKVRSGSCQLIVNPTALSRIDLFDLDQPVMGQPLDFTAASTTKGVTVTKVTWHYMLGDELPASTIPVAGRSIVASCTIHLADGFSFANPCTCYMDGNKQISSSAPTATDKEVSFSFNVNAPAGGAVIDTAYLDFEHGNEPKAGSKPEYLVVRKLEQYDDAYRRDVRYSDSKDTWFREDGSVMPFSEAFQAGKSYTVQVTLEPNSQYGWKFTNASTAELNGEPMDVKLDGQNLIVRKTYSLEDDSTTVPGVSPFEDVNDPGEYYYEPVLWAVAQGITNGTDETHFSPMMTCTRAQVVTFLWRANGSPEPTSTANPFVDVPNDYYTKAVLWAVEKGITNGTDSTHFSPNAPCTRGHVVTFLWRSKGQPKPSSSVNPFVDVPSNEYYTQAVLWAVEKGITNGTSTTTFSPANPCTRGQIVTFLYRARTL